MVITEDDHSTRIQQELIATGMTKYGLLKRESTNLPKIIKPNEHINGVVYGLTGRDSAMIVATDKRVLYLDHKILFHKTDELSYDVVSGVSYNYQGRFSGIVLHTRLGDFKLRFVNSRCAKKFVKYIESRQIMTEQTEEPVNQPTANTETSLPMKASVSLTSQEKAFLVTHEVATLSTVDEDGRPHGASVYYASDKNNFIYVITKSQTNKSRNIDRYPYVALTITDIARMQTMQIAGVAHVETDQSITKRMYEIILRPRFQDGKAQLAPVLFMPAGDYEVIVIEPTWLRLSNYT